MRGGNLRHDGLWTSAGGQRASAQYLDQGWNRAAQTSHISLHIIHLFPHLSPGPAASNSWNYRRQACEECTHAVCAPATHTLTARAASPRCGARAARARRRRENPRRRPPGTTVPRSSSPPPNRRSWQSTKFVTGEETRDSWFECWYKSAGFFVPQEKRAL